VRAKDVAGNSDPSEATFTWTIDTSLPQTTITQGPPAITNSTSASFGFVSSAQNSRFECSLDGGLQEACATPTAYTGLGPGRHTFSVAAIDPANNRDPEPATRTWTVDLTPPDTSITAAPPAQTTSGFASFSFTSEPGAGFQCRLDGGNWTGCSPPKLYGELGLGKHSFEVRALDPAGNVDGSPAAHSWTVIAPAPAVLARTGPRLLSPFPVIRIAGRITRRGVQLRFLSINAPSGTSIAIRCRGRGCPFKRKVQKASRGSRSTGRVLAARAVRVRALEGRFLWAGAQIEISITKAGTIGKYTRFKIRRGKPPTRVDRCLMPNRRKPTRCPRA
jgi:hypothetical protein